MSPWPKTPENLWGCFNLNCGQELPADQNADRRFRFPCVLLWELTGALMDVATVIHFTECHSKAAPVPAMYCYAK